MEKIPRSTFYNKEAEFFGKLLQIRDLAHLTHLRQYSLKGFEHLALDTLYKDIVEDVDTLIETWQGCYQLLDITIPSSTFNADAIGLVRGLYDYVQSARVIFPESWIQNQIDEIVALLTQTLYRLRFMK